MSAAIVFTVPFALILILKPRNWKAWAILYSYPVIIQWISLVLQVLEALNRTFS